MPNAVTLYPNARFTAFITSDNHIDLKHSCPAVPAAFLTASLKDSAKSARLPDAYITVGDTTSRGETGNWELAAECFRGIKPARHIFLTVGNHDLWGDNGFEAAKENYLKYSNAICGTDHTGTWFSHEVNGYRLIFLGNTEDAGCEAHLGQAQLDWLGAELDAAAGRPAFVFCHQSLNGRHGLPRTWDREESATDPMEGGIGTESDSVAAILKAHKNVFYFSGHSHMGFCGEEKKRAEGYASFESEDGVTLVNLPSLACGNHPGDLRSRGLGLILEVYADRVVIRMRDFTRRRMIRRVAVCGGRPYWEQMLK